MTTKPEFIARAQALGSKAATLRGAGKVLIAAAAKSADRLTKRHRNDPVLPRTARVTAWLSAKTIEMGITVDDLAAMSHGTISRYECETRIERAAKSWVKRIYARCGWALAGTAAVVAMKWPLRQSQSKWAGGDHDVTITIECAPMASGGSVRVWADNGKAWSGTNSHAILGVTPSALIHFPTLRTPDGSIVLDAKRVGPREYRLVGIRQGAGFNVIVDKPSWFVRGYHSSAKTLAAARLQAASARQKALAATMRRRTENVSLRTTWVDVDASLRGGNCASQTAVFAAKAYAEIGAVGPCAVRADILLTLRDDVFTRRAVMSAGHA